MSVQLGSGKNVSGDYNKSMWLPELSAAHAIFNSPASIHNSDDVTVRVSVTCLTSAEGFGVKGTVRYALRLVFTPRNSLTSPAVNNHAITGTVHLEDQDALSLYFPSGSYDFAVNYDGS
jgi:hypothetical protein